MSGSGLAKLTASALAFAALTAAAQPGVKHAERAEQALTKRKLDVAVTSAEAAVATAPRDAGFRMLLGRAYLEAGRYRSAASSFADALELEPGHAGAALSLALARIGLGEQDAARAVLERHGDRIAAGDRGLAIALAGDPAAGVALLEAEVRTGVSDAKTRQNLALSYALAGRWPEAKLMASYDLDPVTVAQRIMEWSRFAREQQASTQVAALLGVAPGADPGQPVQLALHAAPVDVQLAEAAPPPPAPMIEAEPSAPPPVAMLAEAPTSEPVVQLAAPVAPPTLATVLAKAPRSGQAIQFAPRAEVVQSFKRPATAVPASVVAARTPTPRAPSPMFDQPGGGRFVVQLGAYDSAGIAEAAWQRLGDRISGLRDLTPSTATTMRGAATFHRLSISGFASRSLAVSFCERLRGRGAQCFVREAAGDVPLQWARRGGGQRFAAR